MWRSAVGHLREHGHEVRVLTTDWREPSADPSIPEDDDVHRELRWYWHDHAFPRMGPVAVARLERHNARVARPPPGGVPTRRRELVGHGRHVAVADHAAARRARPVRGGRRLAAVRPQGRPPHPLHPPARAATARSRAPPRWLFASHTLLRPGARERAGSSPTPRWSTPASTRPCSARRPSAARGAGGSSTAGRIDERKGIDLAIEALAHLPAEARLRVVGSGDDGHLSELRHRAGRLGVRVSFERHPRHELPAHLRGGRRHAVPRPLGGAVRAGPARVDGDGHAGRRLGPRRVGRVPGDGENCLLADPDAGPDAVGRRGAPPGHRAGPERADLASGSRHGGPLTAPSTSMARWSARCELSRRRRREGS